MIDKIVSFYTPADFHNNHSNTDNMNLYNIMRVVRYFVPIEFIFIFLPIYSLLMGFTLNIHYLNECK